MKIHIALISIGCLIVSFIFTDCLGGREDFAMATVVEKHHKEDNQHTAITYGSNGKTYTTIEGSPEEFKILVQTADDAWTVNTNANSYVRVEKGQRVTLCLHHGRWTGIRYSTEIQ